MWYRLVKLNKEATPTQLSESLPDEVSKSHLWRILAKRAEYTHAISGIRNAASVLGAKIAQSMPEYTDHSVKHMDSLWQVTEKILSPAEIDMFSASEAFALGAAFYLHDLGMAGTVTAAGKDEIRATEQYKIALTRFKRLNPQDELQADTLALREATRELHARKAMDWAANPIPGVDRYLIEDSDLRQRWAFNIGQIAASHHWTMEEVERSLGCSKITPGPDGQNLDLGYLACALRVIDFAHIDRARAPKIERKLRSSIPPGSQIHWAAQENVTGPIRDGDYLVYGCTQPISNIDAWWLFYDLACQLDSEIRSVHEYVRNRTISLNRFSLKGVKAIENASAFAEYVRLTEGIVPVDIRVQPESMERVVELLGGHHIYGPDALAPIRELIQNARDAISLRQALERADGHVASPGQIDIALRKTAGQFTLSVRDNGVGMTRSVVRKHLVGVGSDFWNSSEFYRDFRKAVDADFRPIGKFGIGFLSVFMLGDHIEVETEAKGHNRLKLTLDGLGKRGELRETKPSGQSGSEIRVTLKEIGPILEKSLSEVVRARAPMLTIPITVSTQRAGETATDRIEPGWWKRLSDEALLSFLKNWRSYAQIGKPTSEDIRSSKRHYYAGDYYASAVGVGGKWTVKGWPGTKPQYIDETQRLVSQGGEPSFGVVACSQGIAIEQLHIPDVIGLAEVGAVEMTASRESIADTESPTKHSRHTKEEIAARILTALRPPVVSKIDEIHTFGMIPARIGFLRGMASVFGTTILDAAKLSWIPVTIPPGNLIHYSKQELTAALKSQNRVTLAIGIGSGGAYAAASAQIPAAELARMMVLSIATEEIDVPYRVKEQFDHENLAGILKGTVNHILAVLSEQSRLRSEYTASSESQLSSELILTGFILKCVADSWDMSPADLREQSWYLYYKDNILIADLRKV